MEHPTFHMFEHTPDSLGEWFASRGQPSFRAKQVFEWVYEKRTIDPEAMSNLSRLDRLAIKESMTFLSGETVRHQSATDGTQKLLVEWSDGDVPTSTKSLRVIGSPGDSSRQTECVMIPTEDRRTACISSQVGCPVGCKFCASGLGGLDASLSAGRIVEQVYRLGQLEGVSRISNIVFMGMGEPLANLANVVAAIRILNAPWATNISARKITISTVGLPKAIEKLSRDLDLPVTLALSLHAPNDALRRQLIPWAHYTTIKELIEACSAWFSKTGREITLEYTLLRGVNDQQDHAVELAQVARTLRANVNLIRYNEVEGLEFKRPRTDDVLAFQTLLRARGINSHIRASRGRDIAAACGQLRHEAALGER